MTRTALLLTGNLRFCRDFESQVANLVSDGAIDWWVLMWARGHDQDTRITPNWQGQTSDQLAEWIQQRMPQNTEHRLHRVQLIQPQECPPLTAQYREFYANQQNLHQQHWILMQAAAQLAPELANYDLVIRSRPDLGLSHMLSCPDLAQKVAEDPKLVIMPRNERRGPWNCCDQWAAVNPLTAQQYLQSYQLFDQLYHRGVPYNPEYLLGAALHVQGLHWPATDWDVLLRAQGQHVPGHFHPDFGSWL